MYSENNTESIIKQRMLNNVPSDVDTSEGSLIYDAVSPASGELAQVYIDLDQVLNMVFAQSAAANGYSAQLELRCGEFGIARNEGTQATGQATFSGVETTPILTGTIIQTPGGLQYATTSSGVIINGSATVDIQAVSIGSSYNVPANTITQIPTSINGITSVTNASPILNGTDKETDSALLQRFLLQVQTPATSGNAAHYIQWALSVTGIGAAGVFPLWNGPGTVKVCAVDSNKQPLSADLLTSLQNYIESVRPIGATVTYESASGLPINISVNVTMAANYTVAQIQASIEASITSYLQSIFQNYVSYPQNPVQSYVSYAKIGSLILATQGVLDYDSLTVNGGTANISVASEQVAILGAVTVNAS